MAEKEWPHIQPSADPQATAFAIAYAIYTQLPEEKKETEPAQIASVIGSMADTIIKRGVVSALRT